MLNRWQRTIVDLRGNVVPYAQLQVRVEATQAAAEIYRDSAGTEVIPNGIVTANAQGYAFFYAPAGLYRITGAEPVIDWRDVNIGSAEALLRSNNLDDLSSASDARSNLGLGTAATRDVGTEPNEIPTNDDLGSAAYLPIATTAQAQALTADDVVITPQKLGDAMNAHVLGMGQTWQSVTGSRAFDTNYTNTTGRTIALCVTGFSSSLSAIRFEIICNGAVVGGVTRAPESTGGSKSITATAIVPPGAVYSAVTVAGAPISISQWSELR